MVSVVNALNFLFDDRSFIQITGDVMCGRSYQFYAAVICLVVGLRPLKAGQKRMVNVDGAAREFFAKVIR
ncbi:hypothetical protein D3C87_2059840 [compost metagenome]